MKKLILGIGIPGSGKTTILKKFADKNNYVYICPDDIREEMTGNASDQSKNKEVWEEATKRMINNLHDGKSIVFDATFTDQKQRKEFISLARENDSQKIEGIFIEVPLDLAKERNENRERKVPEHAIERMHKNISNFPPEIKDGFDSIFILNEKQELIKVDTANENTIIQKEFTNFR